MANFKTDWTKEDYLLPAQFNRIIGNLEEINVLALATKGAGNAELQSLDDTISAYEADENTVYLASQFNNIEINVQLLASLVGITWIRLAFYPNGQFIKHGELNRLEEEMEYLYGIYANIINHAVRLPITLGARSII